MLKNEEKINEAKNELIQLCLILKPRKIEEVNIIYNYKYLIKIILILVKQPSK